MQRKIGISMVSLLPHSLGVNGLRESIEIAKKLGFDGVQAMPFRGMTEKSFEGVDSQKIISFGTPWNGGPLWRALARQMGIAKDEFENPLLVDWALFGNWKKSIQRTQWLQRFCQKALYVQNPNGIFEGFCDKLQMIYPRSNLIFELCPEMHWTMFEAIVNEKLPVCFDVKHLFRPGRNEEKPLVSNRRDYVDFLNFLKRFKRDQIALIHVGLHDVRVDELGDVLFLLKERSDCPVILEAPPTFSKKKLAEKAEILRENLKN